MGWESRTLSPLPSVHPQKGQLLLVKDALNRCQQARGLSRAVGGHLPVKRCHTISEHRACLPSLPDKREQLRQRATSSYLPPDRVQLCSEAHSLGYQL